MSIYEFSASSITELAPTAFSSAGLQERRDLQRLIREKIEVISPDTLVIAEEFGEWEDSKRRIDLLGIDRDANLVVIELKRTESGGHMELQSIRYAALVSTMTFDKAVDVYERYLASLPKADQDARAIILEHLGWDEPDDGQFGRDVKIVLASADFSKELTASVLWLRDHGVELRCVRLKPYGFNGHTLVDVQQIIPLPEASEYIPPWIEKKQKARDAKSDGPDWTRFDVEFSGEKRSSMYKRNAILFICKGLCEKGISPDEIAALFNWRPSRVWYSVDGTVDSTAFEESASAKAASGGQNFNPRRWFCDQDELCHANGKTYAFSTQWGGPLWHKAMDLLKNKYPQFKIKYDAAT